MTEHDLKNKPLIEAVFEFRWVPPTQISEPLSFTRDPFFYVLQGKLLPLLGERFPEIVSLLPPVSSLPEEILQNTFHFRLCSQGDKKMPLVQIGPGMLTLNAGETYVWESYKDHIEFILTKLYCAYPKPDNFFPKFLALKYLNFFKYKEFGERIADQLRKTFGLTIEMPNQLLQNPLIDGEPNMFTGAWQFPCFSADHKQFGNVSFTIYLGQMNGENGFFGEICVQSSHQQLDNYRTQQHVLEWAEDAHRVTHSCFFAMVDQIKNYLDT